MTVPCWSDGECPVLPEAVETNDRALAADMVPVELDVSRVYVANVWVSEALSAQCEIVLWSIVTYNVQ